MEPVVNATPPTQGTGFNKKIIFALIAVVLVVTAAVLAILAFLPQRREEQQTSREFSNPFEETAVNPFSQETSYQNPFEAASETQDYQNPFEELR